MKVIFNAIVTASIFVTCFAGMMATMVGVCSSVLNFQQAEIEPVIYGIMSGWFLICWWTVWIEVK